ncbi:hypothetical protein LZZ85_22570 [Terrimonas sp. NA20]|uniref:Uncharacterized protein n=1 Tax=Terrimonas ginsenosidimutans TaxID=2908004 RepID=A0ABS9KXN0_9BACT|nr:hypothetical protein [Terrimonas ginsenosidimutans]MCG2617097.1 hypothetical protein [Terrimonas ginsenosidimutans]
MMNFTAHNILLNKGQTTMGSDQILLEKSAIWTSIAKTISLLPVRKTGHA